jgi:hypothetical protein
MTESGLSPQEFVDKWRKAELKERSAAQEQLANLCRAFGHRTTAGGGLCVLAREKICENR